MKNYDRRRNLIDTLIPIARFYPAELFALLALQARALKESIP